MICCLAPCIAADPHRDRDASKAPCCQFHIAAWSEHTQNLKSLLVQILRTQLVLPVLKVLGSCIQFFVFSGEPSVSLTAHMHGTLVLDRHIWNYVPTLWNVPI
jgi:hypothetical protein